MEPLTGHLANTTIEIQRFHVDLAMNNITLNKKQKKSPISFPETFSLSMNTDLNYNPFAPARSLSLQFMIQAVTTSFDPILVMLIFIHNGSKSV